MESCLATSFLLINRLSDELSVLRPAIGSALLDWRTRRKQNRIKPPSKIVPAERAVLAVQASVSFCTNMQTIFTQGVASVGHNSQQQQPFKTATFASNSQPVMTPCESQVTACPLRQCHCGSLPYTILNARLACLLDRDVSQHLSIVRQKVF